jgi:peroxiredoxin
MLAPLLATMVLLAAPYEEGQLLTYKGTFQPVKLDRPDAGKTFELSLLIGPAVDGSTTVYWVLSDSGRDPIPWAERFDKLTWSRDAKTIDGPIPGFLYDHVSGKTRVNIAPPLPLISGELKAGATWSEGKVQFEVSDGEAVDGRPTWDIVARTLVGRRRTMTIDQEDQRVYSVRENVFVGQGEEHLLKYSLVSTKTLDGAALEKAIAAGQGWSAARSEWTSAQDDRTPKNLAAANKELAAKLPELKKASDGTPLAGLAAVATTQLKNSDEQKSAVGAMRSKVVGKPLAKLELKDVANKVWSNETLKGKVTVLHFWSYRDENLREPYGQVGYLDFLARQNGKVQVLGVAVAPDNPEQKQSQRALVRKFRDFMNVSYPILLDDGALLEKLGDPRKVKQELPLFVVIDAKGNVVEYKAGEYDVKANEGLKELEAAVKQAAKQAE